MSPAHHHADAIDRGDAPADRSRLSVSDDHVTVTVQGKLGFDCWKTLCEARRMAIAKHLTLSVEVAHCDTADMAGIGSLLLAIDKLGSIEVVGCNERSSFWFSHLGICRGCSAAGANCRKNLH